MHTIARENLSSEIETKLEEQNSRKKTNNGANLNTSDFYPNESFTCIGDRNGKSTDSSFKRCFVFSGLQNRYFGKCSWNNKKCARFGHGKGLSNKQLVIASTD